MSLRRGLRGLAVAAAVALVVVGVALPSTAATISHSGWTISIATPPTGMPSFAYPFASGDELTTANVERLQQLSYRPLYFFGGGPNVQLNEPLSLATLPVYAAGDTQVSFTIKPGLRWSDGELLTAESVVEWMNLLAAFPGMWGDYLAPLPSGVPLGIPDDVRFVIVSGNTVTMTLSGPVNPTWFTDSELSQITPLPASWDRYEPTRPHVPATGPMSITGSLGHFTAPIAAAGCYSTHWIGDGNTGPSTTFVDALGTRTVVSALDASQAQRCEDVVELYRSMAFDTSDYTAPGTDVAAAWGLSDGPWRLLTYDPSGGYTMAPNRAAGASGQHATAALLSFVPCASAVVCEGLLVHRVVDQGELPLALAPHVSALIAGPSHNPLRAEGYREQVVAPWSTSYLPYNFASTAGAGGHAGRVFSQRYFRQAFQSLVDQPTMIGQALSGYGVATTTPIPTDPVTAFSTSVANPAPFSVARSAALLISHGWHLAPGRLTTCAVPKKCGTGIPHGTPLSFTIEYAASSPALAKQIVLLVHDAVKVGIVLTASPVPTARVLADVGSSSPTWDLASWDGGWQYGPDYYPSGEWLFAQGSSWNVGAFADAHATALVAATLRSPAELAAYNTYVAAQLPVVWQPTPVTLLETRATIHDVAASPLGTLTPEAWRR